MNAELRVIPQLRKQRSRPEANIAKSRPEILNKNSAVTLSYYGIPN
jgi:hypothetical protein